MAKNKRKKAEKKEIPLELIAVVFIVLTGVVLYYVNSGSQMTGEAKFRKVLLIGGGFSYDRSVRKKGVDYWVEEKIDFDNKNIEKLKDIDIVVSHEPPPYIFDNVVDVDFIKPYIKNDACLRLQADRERDKYNMLVKKIIKKNKIKYWVSGHIDKTGMKTYEGINYHALGDLELLVI